MTLNEFTTITLKIVSEQGIADYLPTLALVDTHHMQTIDGIPAHVPHTEAIQKIIARSGFDRKEFFFGVRSGENEITTGHYHPGEPTAFMMIRNTSEGYVIGTLELCAWWQVAMM